MKNVEIINEPVNLQYVESSYAKLGQLAPMQVLQGKALKGQDKLVLVKP